MEATIQKWGNSNALRIPKFVLNSIGIEENEKVEIIVQQDGFYVKKNTPSHISLSERLEKFYNKPIDQIEKIQSEEIDTGNPVGEEVW